MNDVYDYFDELNLMPSHSKALLCVLVGKPIVNMKKVGQYNETSLLTDFHVKKEKLFEVANIPVHIELDDGSVLRVFKSTRRCSLTVDVVDRNTDHEPLSCLDQLKNDPSWKEVIGKK